jgi:Bifunctional DNA primase/polymerase, N-terminal
VANGKNKANNKSKPEQGYAIAATSPAIIAALTYAERGWSVFPCHGIHPRGWGIETPYCTCNLNIVCEHPGKHPRCAHGVNDATCDPAIIRRWYPNSNIAIATGAISGIFIIDIDPRNGGGVTLAQLEGEHGPFPRDAVVWTGGAGIHLYYAYPKTGGPIGNGGNVFGPGIDLKGNGGYVIAPPSLHYSLKQYRWRGGVMPTRLPTAPVWLLAMARKHKSEPRGLRAAESNIKTADHSVGRIIAKLLGGEDRISYWKINCPAGDHQTPDGAMYPHADGKLHFVCFSGNPCWHDQIKAAVVAIVKEELR